MIELGVVELPVTSSGARLTLQQPRRRKKRAHKHGKVLGQVRVGSGMREGVTIENLSLLGVVEVAAPLRSGESSAEAYALAARVR